MLVLEYSAVQGNPCSRCTVAAFAKTVASVMTVQLVCWVSMTCRDVGETSGIRIRGPLGRGFLFMAS